MAAPAIVGRAEEHRSAAACVDRLAVAPSGPDGRDKGLICIQVFFTYMHFFILLIYCLNFSTEYKLYCQNRWIEARFLGDRSHLHMGRELKSS